MWTLSELIERFTAASDQIWIVRDIEDIRDPVVDEFYSHLLEAEVSADVKVEILRSAEVRSCSPEKKHSLARAIIGLLASSDDEILQQHSATALRNFWESPGVLEALFRAANDPQFDLDARYNALDSLVAHIDTPSYGKAVWLLRELDDEIGEERTRPILLNRYLYKESSRKSSSSRLCIEAVHRYHTSH